MNYYIMYQGQVTGPMSKEQMMAYGVNRNTMVSAEGGEWRALYTYPELMELLASSGYGVQYGGEQRQMSLGTSIKTVLSKYACFSGRAQRSEFWWWTLVYYILSYIVSTVTYTSYADDMRLFIQTLDFGYYPFEMYSLNGLFSLVFLLPNLGVTVRRLHDTGRSGWWVLLYFLCCIGNIILLVWLCQASQDTENEYGPVPGVE